MVFIKKVKKISAVCFLFFSISIAFAQKSMHPIDVMNRQCRETSIPTTSAAMECEKSALTAWEIEMNTYLERLKKKREQLDIALLEESQRKWEAFFNADIAVYNSYLNKLYKGGTLSRVAILRYRKERVRKRTFDLEHFFEDLE